MDHAISLYKAAYEKHGYCSTSLFLPKGKQKERFDILTSPINREGFSVLDFGCGFGDLKSYLDERFSRFSYSGVDIVDSFILECRRRHQSGIFRLIRSPREVQDDYDYVIISGTFNLLYCPDASAHRDIVFATLRHLFARTRKCLAVDFLSDQVDFQQENAYHQAVPEIYQFVRQHLSPRLILHQATFPYEFSLLIFKNQRIVRPINLYEDDGA